MKCWRIETNLGTDGSIEIKIFEDSTWQIISQTRSFKLDELNKLWDMARMMTEAGYTHMECNLIS